MTLSGKKILIGITGGIAAYKICELIRSLKKLNADVKVVLTPAAKEFVTETTLRTLTQNQVYCEQFNVEDWKPEHISLADDSDLFIIAPASANTIGKIANGICDNLLTSLVLAFRKSVILAPAMNCNMWENTALQKNLTYLKSSGFKIIEPEKGFLACGYEGKGRMAEPEVIKEKVIEFFSHKQFLAGQKIVVTAGGTKENIDPVRYIGNYSSGRMGIAIADAAFALGADVILVSSVYVEKPYNIVVAESAEEMFKETKKAFEKADSLIMAAAVADYKPEKIQDQKIKKQDNDSLVIKLVKNPDILKEMAAIKTEKQTVIGFCAESENLLGNAKEKIKNKNLDYIVANDISRAEIGFNSDYNEVLLINKEGEVQKIERMPKIDIARKLLERIFNG